MNATNETVHPAFLFDEQQIGETLFLFGPPRDPRHIDNRQLRDLIEKGAKIRRRDGLLYIYMKREAAYHV